MRSLVLCALLLLVSAASSVSGDATQQGGTTGTQGELENPKYKELAACRVKPGVGVLEQAECYELTLQYAPRNVTLYASLALLYLKGGFVDSAKKAMNTTMQMWLTDEASPHIKPEEEGKMSYVDILRRVYDHYKDTKDEEKKKLTVEVGMVLAKKFELDHKPTDAHSVYYGFLGQLGIGQDNLVDFHRRTGNIIALTHVANTNVSIGFRIVEAINAIVDGLIPHLMSYGEIPKGHPIKRMCGTEFKHGQNDEIFARDVTAWIMDCVESWGNYTETLEKEEPLDRVSKPYSVLKYTPLHRMAFLNAKYLLEKSMVHLGEKKKIPADRFGRGLMHYAAGGAAPDTTKFLVDNGAKGNKGDAGSVMPANLGCTVPKFKDHYEQAAGEDTCLGFRRNNYIDEDIDITDETGTDAGWNKEKVKNPPNFCDIDIRDMSKTFQHDVNLQHLMPNYPVVLRNAFYEEEDGPRKEWGMKHFNKTFHKVLLRHETTPGGEFFGIGEANASTLGEYMATLGDADGTIGSVVVDNGAHRLDKIASWVPPSLVNKKNGNSEVTYFDIEHSSPTLFINKKKSQSHHQVRAYMNYHTVFYGWQEFTLLPPHLARTTRGQLNEVQKEHSLRCHLHTGDVLILPEMWSSSWVSHANGLSAERNFYRAEGQD